VAIRSASYATWFGMPLVAAFALRLFAMFRLQGLIPRAALGVLLTPAMFSLGAVTVANAAGIGSEDDFYRAEPEACFANESYARLARLPAGIVAADVNFGPFLLALTPHNVLTAPYHRLATRIVAAHRVLAAPPEEARRALARAHADYVVTCGKGRLHGLRAEERDASLLGRLQAGAVPDWLERVPGAGAFAVYRVRP